MASVLWLGTVAPVWAEAEAPSAVAELSVDADNRGLQLRSTGEVLQLSAALNFELPTLVEDALYKGIPVHFVQSARMVSERWYWSDKLIAQVERHMRLSYQPLTRRWRLYSSSSPLNERGQGGGVALGVGFDSLDDALQSMQRITRWSVAELSQLPSSGELLVELQMRIDIAQLPRPLQIGTLGRKSWSVLESRVQRVDVLSLQ
ncbi:DUF4390 domain-containing protein [Comamonas sp. GB3 AK4-5]|uniref:DUF4390 domain-containing protein n=1 Tax=Comamonas sp. GB3 AK4-5 TaxID=3231487 RepID=UPI00351DBF64